MRGFILAGTFAIAAAVVVTVYLGLGVLASWTLGKLGWSVDWVVCSVAMFLLCIIFGSKHHATR